MKRTKDGRFIEERIVVDKKILKDIIFEAKKKTGLNWIKFAKTIGVSPITLQYEWLIEDRTIPKSPLKKLTNLVDKKFEDLIVNSITKEPFWGQKISHGKLKLKEIKIPSIKSKEFSEFYGILLGDGCIFSNMKGLSITGDKFFDRDYYNYISSLIHHLFGIYPSLYESKRERTIRCVVYSKKVTSFFSKLNFPIGVKYDKEPTIPKYFFENKTLLAYCIRGLMDTDGSLSAHPNSKAMIHLSITIKSLRDSVKKGLDELGINGGVFNKGIMIYGSEKIKQFNDIIGFSNRKNIIKYREFLGSGKVPSSKQLETFIRDKTAT